MACVVKERRVNRGVRYRVQVRTPGGKLLALRGWDFKSGAEAVCLRIDRLEKLKRDGDQPDAEMIHWIEALPVAWREKLLRAGLIDARRIIQTRPLWYHLMCFWHVLKAKGRTARHCKQVIKRIVRILRGTGWKHHTDITVGTAEAFLMSLRDGTNPVTASTFNHYRTALREFSRWMVCNGRAYADPLAGLKPLEAAKVRRECRRERRAATPEEIRALLETTEHGPIRKGVPGAERRLVYWLAVESGLRAGEIKSLKAGDFDLGDNPGVTIRARGAKNSETVTLPLPRALADALKNHLAAKISGAPAFGLPHISNVSKMLKKDLEAAGVAYVDDGGRYLDFHAARHTRGVWLCQYHGATPRETQELMRVSSLALVDRYSRSFRLTDIDIAERGPQLVTPPTTEQEAEKTGTDDQPVTPETKAHQKAHQSPEVLGHCSASCGTNNEDMGRDRNNTKPQEKRDFPRFRRLRAARLERATYGLKDRCSTY